MFPDCRNLVSSPSRNTPGGVGGAADTAGGEGVLPGMQDQRLASYRTHAKPVDWQVAAAQAALAHGAAV